VSHSATVELVEDLDRLEELAPAWDRLAEACGAPYCSPAWMLPWWRHVAPPRSRLRVVVVGDGDEMDGIAPFYARGGRAGIARYRALASGTSFRVGPIARPGAEARVAALVAETLRASAPAPDLLTLEGFSASTTWSRALRAAGRQSGPPWVYRHMEMPAPTLTLVGRTYEEWLASKSSNFRQQMGRFRRRFEKKGGAFRIAASEAEARADLASFAVLHYSRWAARGGSNALNPGAEEMLRETARRLEGTGRFRLWVAEVGGRAVSAQVFLAAGGEVSYWNGGFDEAWASDRPALQTIMAAIRHAWEAGDRRVDFGAGGQEYKYRFSDGEDLLEWVTIVARTRRYPLARAILVPVQLRRQLARRLPETTKQRLRQRLHGDGRSPAAQG
jgi:CelD/BcsL family acetyltransferase involved in cellulose biosynthesis